MFNRYKFQDRLFPTAVILLGGRLLGKHTVQCTLQTPARSVHGSVFTTAQRPQSRTALFTVVPGYYSNTNAHYHSAKRPKSSIQCTTDYSYYCLSANQGYASVDGVFSFYQNATLVGQAEVLTITCHDTNTGAASSLNTDYAVGYNDVYYNDHPEIWERIGAPTQA